MTRKYKITVSYQDFTGILVATYRSGKLKRLELQSGIKQPTQFSFANNYVPLFESSIEDLSTSDHVIFEQITAAKKTASTYKQAMDLFFEWYTERTGLSPRINAVEGKALKAIIAELNKRSADGAEALAIWKHLLTNWNKLDKFYRNQIELRQINSNLSIILRTLKNGKSGQAKSATAHDFRKEI